MKRLFILLVAISFFVSELNAQAKRESNASENLFSSSTKKARNKELMKELNLTDEQKSQIKELHQSIKQKKQELDRDKNLTSEKKKEKKKALQKEEKEKFDSLLTPEQKQKMKEIKGRGKNR